MACTLVRTDNTLVARLDPVARQARVGIRALAHEVYTNLGDSVDPVEFQHTSESSAFLAFTALGGDPDRPDDFDWVAGLPALVAATIRNIEVELAGPHSRYWDFRARMRRRSERAVIKDYRWTQWDSAGGIAPDEGFGSGTVFEWCYQNTPQELDYHQIEMDALHAALDDVLTPQEVHLLVEHYMYGRSYRDLADDMLAANDLLRHDPRGHVKAMNRIASALHRARLRAADRLGVRWFRLLEDAA